MTNELTTRVCRIGKPMMGNFIIINIRETLVIIAYT